MKSKATIDAILKDSGPTAQIAARHGVSRSCCYVIRRNAGLIRERNVTEQVEKQMRELRKKGMSFEAIAKTVGFRTGTVYDHLSGAHKKLKDRGYARVSRVSKSPPKIAAWISDVLRSLRFGDSDSRVQPNRLKEMTRRR